MPSTINPIWKDYYVQLGDYDSRRYRIMLGSDVIFAGTAYRRPGEDVLKVRINDVCADWLAHPDPDTGQEASTPSGLQMTFSVYDDEADQFIQSVTFVNDWSYDPEWDPTGLASEPVTGRVDGRQPLLLSAYSASSLTAVITKSDGTQQSVTLQVGNSADYNIDFNLDFAVTVNAVLNLADYPTAVKVTVAGVTWEVAGRCRRYALYYSNAHGGWDTLLVEGAAKRTDEVERFTAHRPYDNTLPQNRGELNYVNGVTRTWELRTGWMSDQSAARMHHLLESTAVYLYDIAEGTMTAVTLTGTECEYKEFLTQGRRMADYSITARDAQQRSRR